jgi:hypothetical protein
VWGKTQKEKVKETKMEPERDKMEVDQWLILSLTL